MRGIGDRRARVDFRNAIEPRRGNGRETSEGRLTSQRSFSRFCLLFGDAQSEAPINRRLARKLKKARPRPARRAPFHESRLQSTERPLLADRNARCNYNSLPKAVALLSYCGATVVIYERRRRRSADTQEASADRNSAVTYR